MEKERIEWIDAFKGIAVIGVFLVHCGNLAFPHIYFISRYGNRGVELFFIITGYLTCCKPLQIDTKKDFGCWLLKKYIRIMPLAIITYIVSGMLNYVNCSGGGGDFLRVELVL